MEPASQSAPASNAGLGVVTGKLRAVGPLTGHELPFLKQEAAHQYSPRRKPWEQVENDQAPAGAKEKFQHTVRSSAQIKRGIEFP